MFKLTRYKSAQWTFAGLALFYGFAFFIFGVMGMQAMDPGQYGEVAVSLEIEAIAGVQLCGALMMAFGLMFNGRWRWSPGFRLAGSIVVAMICALLAWSAFGAPNGWPMGVLCAGFACLGVIVAWFNLVDLRAAIFWGGGDVP